MHRQLTNSALTRLSALKYVYSQHTAHSVSLIILGPLLFPPRQSNLVSVALDTLNLKLWIVIPCVVQVVASAGRAFIVPLGSEHDTGIWIHASHAHLHTVTFISKFAHIDIYLVICLPLILSAVPLFRISRVSLSLSLSLSHFLFLLLWWGQHPPVNSK